MHQLAFRASQLLPRPLLRRTWISEPMESLRMRPMRRLTGAAPLEVRPVPSPPPPPPMGGRAPVAATLAIGTRESGDGGCDRVMDLRAVERAEAGKAAAMPPS